VAERVLTLDELKAYVDRQCPSTAVIESTKLEPPSVRDPADRPVNIAEELRYLLARLLARAERCTEARDY
jgi:hypothetical protein